jgi:hypothetical protein
MNQTMSGGSYEGLQAGTPCFRVAKSCQMSQSGGANTLEILIELCTAQPSEWRTDDSEGKTQAKATCRRRIDIDGVATNCNGIAADGAATNCNGIAAAVNLGQNAVASTK